MLILRRDRIGDGSSFIDFDRHTEVFEAAYRWCNSEIDRLIAEHNRRSLRDHADRPPMANRRRK
jgi:hypothetical protein